MPPSLWAPIRGPGPRPLSRALPARIWGSAPGAPPEPPRGSHGSPPHTQARNEVCGHHGSRCRRFLQALLVCAFCVCAGTGFSSRAPLPGPTPPVSRLGLTSGLALCPCRAFHPGSLSALPRKGGKRRRRRQANTVAYVTARGDSPAEAAGPQLSRLPHPNRPDSSVTAEGGPVFVFKDGFATSSGLDRRLLTGPEHARLCASEPSL